jgi:hypothetical protein
MELFDALAVAQHGGAQATGMTPLGRVYVWIRKIHNDSSTTTDSG